MPSGIYPRTKEHGRKISLAKKGCKGYWTGKKRPNFSGKYHNWWKGGTSMSNGYVMILTPHHPSANKYGYVLRSHLIAESHLDRFLKPEEVVHHCNEIKDDDRLENFIVFINNSVHLRFHYTPNKIKLSEIIFDGRTLSTSTKDPIKL